MRTAILILLVLNLALTSTIAFRGPGTLQWQAFTEMLGQREGQILVLRAALQQAQQRIAELEGHTPTPGK